MEAGTVIYLDTHVVLWLYADGGNGLSNDAREGIETAFDLLISPMVLLELDFLHEIDRITVNSESIFTYLEQRIGLKHCSQPFIKVVQSASRQTWTRDLFDRIICAQAALSEAPLITKDQTIHEHYPHALW